MTNSRNNRGQGCVDASSPVPAPNGHDPTEPRDSELGGRSGTRGERVISNRVMDCALVVRTRSQLVRLINQNPHKYLSSGKFCPGDVVAVPPPPPPPTADRTMTGAWGKVWRTRLENVTDGRNFRR